MAKYKTYNFLDEKGLEHLVQKNNEKYSTIDSLNTETTERKQSDNTLQSNINTETSERKEKDSLLQNSISAEINDRKSEDLRLQENIDSEALIRQSNDEAEIQRATASEDELSVRINTLENKSKLSDFEDDLSYNSKNPSKSSLKHNHDHLYLKKDSIISAIPKTDPWNLTEKDKAISAELSSNIERRVFNLETGGTGEVRGVYLDDTSVMVNHEALIKSTDIKTLNRIYKVYELPQVGEKYVLYVLMSGLPPYSVYVWEYYSLTESGEPGWQWKEVCKSTIEAMPEVGDVNKLYRTSDGKVYHCYYTTIIVEGEEVQEIHWVEMGSDSLEIYPSVVDFPADGSEKKLYFSISNSKFYQWSPSLSSYKEIFGGEEIRQLQIDVNSLSTNLSSHVNNNSNDIHGFTKENLSVLKNLADDGKSSVYKEYLETETDSTYFTQKGAYDLYTELNDNKLGKTDAVFDVGYSSDNLKFTKKVWNKDIGKKETVDIVTTETLKKDLLLDKVSNTSDIDKPASTDVINRLSQKVNYTDIANDLETANPQKTLAAPQGIALKTLIENAIIKWSGLVSSLSFQGTVDKEYYEPGDPEGMTYLPTTGQKRGDFYQTKNNSKTYGWNEIEWVELDSVITIRNYIADSNEVKSIIERYGN